VNRGLLAAICTCENACVSVQVTSKMKHVIKI